MKSDGKGLRFNKGKIRYDLVPQFPLEQIARVLTYGAQKYEENNWRRGMKWSNVIASLERHLQAIKSGEDFDPETGILHSAHIATNAMFLTEYYRTFPSGDDRPHDYLRDVKIGLDIDEVLADWVGARCDKFGYNKPDYWNFSYENKKHFDDLTDSGELKEFYLNIPAKVDPNDIPFEPHCYITSRSIPDAITKEWLQRQGFATAPVYSVGFGQSKVDVAKEAGIDLFVDDSFKNFVELNNAGICTFLWDAKHNRRHNVGFKRIHSFQELLDPSISRQEVAADV